MRMLIFKPGTSLALRLPKATAGAILADPVRSIDGEARRLSVAGRAPEGVVAEVRAKLVALLGVGG